MLFYCVFLVHLAIDKLYNCILFEYNANVYIQIYFKEIRYPRIEY